MADELIFTGAEAEVRRGTYLGIPCIVKQRLPKAYRHPVIDARIRKERTRSEAMLLAEANAAGVATPRVLDADLPSATLRLEAIEGETLRALLARGDARSEEVCRAFGDVVGRLHSAGLVHGDLTTSNVMTSAHGLVLIDLGLAHRSAEVEDRGVDLHLVERTFAATHPERPAFHAAFLQGYRAAFPAAAAVIARMDEIRERGRYA